MTLSTPLSLRLRPEARQKSRSTASPTARITLLQRIILTSSVEMGRRRPDAIELAEPGFGHLDALHLAVFADDAVRRGQEHEAHALLLGRLDFLGDGRHVLAFAPVNDGGRSAHAHGRAGGIDGGVASADHRRVVAERHSFAGRRFFEERQGGAHAGEFGAGQIDPVFLPSADRQEHRVETRVQLIERQILADDGVEDEIDPQTANDLDLAIQHRLRQAVLRQGVSQHAPGSEWLSKTVTAWPNCAR